MYGYIEIGGRFEQSTSIAIKAFVETKGGWAEFINNDVERAQKDLLKKFNPAPVAVEAADQGEL